MLQFAEWLESNSVSLTIQSVGWIIPLLQSIHILMIGVVFVSILIVVLRVLGYARADEPVDAVRRRFAPWMWSGLLVMTLTGVLLVVGEPVRELLSLSFWLKMALLSVGVGSAWAFSRSLASGAATDGAGVTDAAPSRPARSAAIATVALWLAIIFLGRAIAYDVEIWGALSLAPGA